MNLIVGVGNRYRRDEGVGPAVIDRLESSGRNGPETSIVDAGLAGVGLLDVARGARRMVVVDAVRSGARPGTVIVLGPEALLGREPRPNLSLHAADLIGVIDLARALDHPLPEIRIVGIEAADLGWGEGLSPEVDAALDEAVEAALAAAVGGAVGPNGVRTGDGRNRDE